MKAITKTAIIKTDDLRNAFSLANTLKVDRTLPILSYAKLSVNKYKAVVTVTDRDRSIEISVDTNSDDEFELLLPRKSTQSFLSGGSDNTLIELDADNLTKLIRNSYGEFKFKPQKVSDFPTTIQPSDNIKWSTIDTKWFCHMLDILLPACADDDSRPILTGVVFGDGSMASADGFRLVSVIHDNCNFGIGVNQFVIHSMSLSLIKKLFSKEKSVNIGFGSDKVFFKSENITFYSRTILGTYPNWKQLIPSSFSNKISFSSPLMIQRLNMMDIKTLSSNIVKLRFHNDTSECLLSGGLEYDYDGFYSLRLPVKIDQQEEAKIAFNYEYLRDAVKHFSICNLELSNASAPGKFTGDIDGLTIVVMPMFVQW